MKTIRELSKALQERTLTSEELVRSCLKKIEEENEALNAFIWVSGTAIDEAKEIDLRREAGEELSVLAGIPIAVKDNILVQGWEITAGSQILENHKGAYDATVIERLKNAGAILIGRTNMDEFAMGSSTETSHYGSTKNPHDRTKVPGGSSGGSAVAVAAGFVPCALGSDTGGSVRQPASLCGVVGLKPTYGRVSRYGLIPMASSLDQIGPFTNTIEDAALVMEVIEGKDENDATSIELASTTAPELIEPDVKGLRIGLPKEYFVEGMDEEIRMRIDEAVKKFEAAGAIIKEVSLPHAKYALAAYYIVAPSEITSNLGRFDGLRYGYHSQGSNLLDTYERTRGEGFGPEVKRRIMLGSYTLSAGYYDAYYKKALQVRSLIKQDFDEALKEVDVILTPTSPSVAWDLGAKFDDPITMYLSDIYTITANLAAIPAISIPCGTAHGLPVGLQLMGKAFDEHMLYRAGMWFEKNT
ncbi:aspartyl/glutamyl-tRNA amidotransferase subunit A [Candidatus Uhrbacteria bacterium RIFCSPHIGHO2_02_FULL_47_44]|uniref:Glutamyl-tRNA(Gln) amidotransferase subunit A n=1 Tax=Candidatus Uhrbacteria bacterium RIFCSPLOWO2_02_FULL_48_18 TaxID=1802408 RepID=A0A1F7VAV4_9BACT|nr:MAG: aspartyl/glutamyl-tRNA amidotransferase subunit A [Candidatus Uhrbacteria bacterium RIFCSPHIGHO2_02_FULL_47_44]OGL76158.1 MAG: aspartyl/glutamyl-tRNA amidotransferase subunit A [Candidatus Uhrbacteria bacterium RIFCSPHIGHO2_12_FULL_47_12]OGL81921.1 MAG: aspartyl/glutamyl-tRNA amidotransferase subunit A [Candidatus Uhrbacteria bacterium RIFCSPLOWO2_01_FULL_47_17]OGL87084.1 MAG: aspartyl/glutamyl-tRNA amidotransferase subunit A [Candidatus Uhrbacteria bacterium RIFCSPLOWO2_02_FULL_48_18]O